MEAIGTERAQNSLEDKTNTLKNKASKEYAGDSESLVNENPIYSLKESAVFLGLSIWAVRELIWKGKLAVVQPLKKMYITRQDLENFNSKYRKFKIRYGKRKKVKSNGKKRTSEQRR